MSPYTAKGTEREESEIALLLEGNRCWAEARTRLNPDLFPSLARVHAPPYLLVGCCDARKPLDLVTGAEPGMLFLHRNVGNQVRHDDSAIGASLQFAIETLGVRHAVVCGHTRCGGMQSALAGDPGGDLGRWLEPVRDLARREAAELARASDADAQADRLAELNVLLQLENLLRDPTVQRALSDEHRPFRVHGWMFRIGTGRIEQVVLPLARWRDEGLLD